MNVRDVHTRVTRPAHSLSDSLTSGFLLWFSYYYSSSNASGGSTGGTNLAWYKQLVTSQCAPARTSKAISFASCISREVETYFSFLPCSTLLLLGVPVHRWKVTWTICNFFFFSFWCTECFSNVSITSWSLTIKYCLFHLHKWKVHVYKFRTRNFSSISHSSVK